MAEPTSVSCEQELHELEYLLWGPEVRSDIFKRWSQGFQFSITEKSALQQNEGGPCAIIAPVQAFIIKNMLSDCEEPNLINNISEDKRNELLVQAMCEILHQCNVSKFRLVSQNIKPNQNSLSPVSSRDNSEPDVLLTNAEVPQLPDEISSDISIDSAQFHSRLNIQTYTSIIDVEKYYLDNIQLLQSQYGVLLFLYSVLATKGIDNVKIELSDTSESLIHETYGYGSQGLINLMITGRAVAHVWDNEQDIGGLKLRGIDRQSQIGFITLMEHMRYCTVGSFYKNPKHPVWVLGSETHLTVLFSTEKKLVSPESASERARRIFKSYDPEGNNFISSVLLQDVLTELDLVSESDYVNIMKKKLDPENLGIILLHAFMDEFYPKEESSTPDTFPLMHYNGLIRSNPEGKIKYNVGMAVLLECELKSICDSNPMLTCLQTKWPSIEVNWTSVKTPSLN
ncbi:uncharacterized protein CBL_13004 [Carabus blaptoides fortunei]